MDKPMRLILRSLPRASQIALLSGSELLEFYQEEDGADSLVGAIFLGRVERVLPDVGAAFVRLGLAQNGFLPLREAESFHSRQGPAALRSGQEVLVQVRKDPKGDKGAFLTRDIALPGQYALVMPNNLFVGLSKRIQDDAGRRRTRELGQAVGGGRFGLILRHAALNASAEDVRAEAEELWSLWQEIRRSAECRKAPALMRREPSMVSVLARDYAGRHPLEVCACLDRPEGFPLDIPWTRTTDAALEALWRSSRIDDQLARALNRRVELDGGSLVIDEREALHTIDLNSGANVLDDSGNGLALQQNLAAAPEIARQIRLRNLSGIILVDFIDMRTDEDRARVRSAMEEAVRDDRIKTVIHGFTRLGLLEMTRKRTRDTLRDALTEPCGACRESGRVARPTPAG